MPTKKTPPRAAAKAKATKKRPPRRGGGLKITAKFEALIGQPRECTECHATTDISLKTYAISKKSPDGVSLVCRVCQGRAAALAEVSSELFDICGRIALNGYDGEESESALL